MNFQEEIEDNIFQFKPAIVVYDTTQTVFRTISGGLIPENPGYLSNGDKEGIKAIYGPPFHRLEVVSHITRDQIIGNQEFFSSIDSIWIRFYSDEQCNIPTSLSYNRKIGINITTELCYSYNNPSTNTSYNCISLPAGTSSYFLGVCNNSYEYLNSDPNRVNMTSYSIINKQVNNLYIDIIDY